MSGRRVALSLGIVLLGVLCIAFGRHIQSGGITDIGGVLGVIGLIDLIGLP